MIEASMAIENLIRVVEAFGTRLTQNAGRQERLMLEAEKRLGLRLPEVLREFYLSIEDNNSLVDLDFSIASLQHLAVHQRYLTFASHQRGLFNWGLLINEESPDPAVFLQESETIAWVQDCKRLSTFLINWVSWQVLMSLPATLEIQTQDIGIPAIRRNAITVEASLGYYMSTFANFDAGVLISDWRRKDVVYLGSRSSETLARFVDQLKSNNAKAVDHEKPSEGNINQAVQFVDPVLGELTWSQSGRAWEGKLLIDRRVVDLSLDTDDDQPTASERVRVIAQFKSNFPNLHDEMRLLMEAAAQRLVDLAATSEIDVSLAAQSLLLDAIAFNRTGELHCQCEPIFPCQVITVFFDEELTIYDLEVYPRD